MDFWAKTGPDEAYLPLFTHLADAAAVADRLWTLALTLRQRVWLADRLGVGVDEARSLVVFLCAAHDCGKLSPTFQRQAPDLAHTLLDGELALVGDDGLGPPLRHDGIGGWLLTEWVAANGGSSELAERLAAAISGHHGTPRRARDVRKRGRRERGRAPDWRPHQDELLDRLAKVHEMPDVACMRAPDDAVVLALAGLVSVADWIASDTSRFPITASSRRPDSEALAADAVSSPHWGPRPVADDATFAQVFSFPPRAAQRAMVEELADLELPVMVILEDRTGSGKTEAALWATLRALQEGARGIYVGLPTRATADQFHGRAQRFLNAVWHQAATTDVRLLHGGAHLTDVAVTPTQVDGGAEDAAAREWFAAPRRGLLSPYAVGTIDQALLAVLRTRFYPVRLWGLQGKVVVLDEVHAYDTYTGLLLERLVSWLAALDCTVVLLSATLPARRRAALCAAYANGASGDETPAHLPATEAYPRLTLVDRHGARSIPIADDRPGRRVALAGLPVVDDTDAVAAAALLQVAEGGCVGLVCSTVALAQARFERIRVLAGSDVEVMLLHARMRPLERTPVEQRLVGLLGPQTAGPDRPERLLVVATQVVEQSLDLDFDVLLTDLAPIDLLVQRAGRVHRHSDRERPDAHREPRLVILDTPGEGATRDLPRGAGAVYVDAVLARTRILLRDRSALVEPEDLDGLIEGVYGDPVPGAATDREHADIVVWDADAASDARRLGGWAVENAIGTPHAEARPWEQGKEALADPDAPEATGRTSAATRWSERPSVSVVILATAEVGLMRRVPGGLPAQALLRRAVNLSPPAVVHALLEADEHFRPAAWRHHGALRHHFCVVVDDNGRATAEDGVTAPQLQWDSVLGVRA